MNIGYHFVIIRLSKDLFYNRFFISSGITNKHNLLIMHFYFKTASIRFKIVSYRSKKCIK